MNRPAGRTGSGDAGDGRVGTSATMVDWVRLLRPKQWAKSAFVLIGPLYALSDHRDLTWQGMLPAALAAAAAFALASSACYIVNDLVDAPLDRAHPRKRLRPIASGVIAPGAAKAVAAALAVLAAAAVVLVGPAGRGWTAAFVGAYAANVLLYSAVIKRAVIADVISLALGFVLRVLGGCAAVGVAPSSWLLNCTFFLAMFLAFGKRLGERRTMARPDGSSGAAEIRPVQSAYTDEMLRMAVVVTAVATLVTYAGYVQSREDLYGSGGPWGVNLLWFTMIPATYGLLRCIVLLERGTFDDPTELAMNDRLVQGAILVFAVITGSLVILLRAGG